MWAFLPPLLLCEFLVPFGGLSLDLIALVPSPPPRPFGAARPADDGAVTARQLLRAVTAPSGAPSAAPAAAAASGPQGRRNSKDVAEALLSRLRFGGGHAGTGAWAAPIFSRRAAFVATLALAAAVDHAAAAITRGEGGDDRWWAEAAMAALAPALLLQMLFAQLVDAVAASREAADAATDAAARGAAAGAWTALALLTHLQVTPPTALSGAETRALRKLLRGDAGFVYPTLRSAA